ncbi:LCP family protein [Streptomyces peucetius]|uniref:LCP family protein n=1 Tax=Streptomyces peucetius TaxID=1950 RepID=A0ABY6I638_STRPE|nr:LCP family protein [Streptomyces peucetius]UYQ62461.1 LCP family protein [Streptomyces peucetius]
MRGEGTREYAAEPGGLGRDDGLRDDGVHSEATVRVPRSRRAPDDERSAPEAAGGGHRRGGTGRRAKRGKHRILRGIAITTSVLVLGTAGAGYLYYEYLNSKLKKDDLTLGSAMPDHKANAAGQTPLNILLIGSDARDSKENQKLGGAKKTFGAPPLADVQMLVHLSADRSNISVISMPRDTLVKIPECTDPDKPEKTYPASEIALTNESLGRGGPGCTVATWYELTGITIDHFMMIDFAGVVSMADAIGGVPVCVEENIHSRTRDGKGSGLKLEAGTTDIKGEQALQWLRTRYGFDDGTDLARAHGQHMYMNSMVRTLRKNTKLTDPNKLRKLAGAAIDALTVDKGIDTVKGLFDLGTQLKSVPTARITMTTMPNVYSERPGYKGKVEPMPGDAEKLFRMVREDIPLDGKGPKKPPAKPVASKDPADAPAEIAVMVRNGTGGDGQYAEQGRATAVTELLADKGFALAKADTTLDPQQTTVVLYSNAELEGDAQAVAKSLGIPVSSVKRSTDATGIQLIVGADWRQGDTYPKTSAKPDNKTPETANVLRGDNEDECMPVQPGFTWS